MSIPPRTSLTCAIAFSLSLPVPTAQANPSATADPFQGSPASTEVPSPEGPEWEAPSPPPPAPPPPPPVDIFDPPNYPYRESAVSGPSQAPEDPPAGDSEKRLMTAGIVVMGAAVGSGILTYYTYDTRQKTESSLRTVEQGNAALIAAGLPPQDTTDLEQKIKLNRTLSIGFGIGAAALLITGGVLFLAGFSRKRQSRPITWTPRLVGIEVSF
jgi:hypothetical protein